MTATTAPVRPGASLSTPVSPDRVARRTPEARGLARDHVRLLVADPDGLHHTRFDRLGDHLGPGDLLVVNTSATRAAALVRAASPRSRGSTALMDCGP